MPDAPIVIKLPSGTLQNRRVNEHAVPDNEPNRGKFVGADRPATREEILAFIAENNARYAREHPDE